MRHSQDPSINGEFRKGCQETLLTGALMILVPVILASLLVYLTAANLVLPIVVLFAGTFIVGAFLSEGYSFIKAIFQALFSIFSKKKDQGNNVSVHETRPYSWTYAIVGLILFGLAAFLFRDGSPSTGDQTHYYFVVFGFGYGAGVAWFVHKGYINPSEWEW